MQGSLRLAANLENRLIVVQGGGGEVVEIEVLQRGRTALRGEGARYGKVKANLSKAAYCERGEWSMVLAQVLLALTLCSPGSDLAGAELRDAETVCIGSTEFVTVADTPQYCASERACIILKRVVTILSELRWGEDPEVEVVLVKGTPVMRARGHIVVTVTEEDLQFHGSTTEGLTSVWVKHLDKAFREVAPREREQ